MTANREKKIAELLPQVGLNATASAELLSIAAGYFEAGKPLPESLAKLFAKAIRQAVAEPSSERGRMLAFELGLDAQAKTGRPRKDIPNGDLALTVAVFGEAISETELKKGIAKTYGVAPETARKRIKEAKAEQAKAREETDELLKRNGLKSTVRTR